MTDGGGAGMSGREARDWTIATLKTLGSIILGPIILVFGIIGLLIATLLD